MFTTFTSSVTRSVVGAIGMALCAGVCLVGATAPANAEPVRTATVHYADLDLANSAGRATLDRRLLSAARSVCTSSDSGPDAAIAEAQCIHHALVAARAKLGTPVRSATL